MKNYQNIDTKKFMHKLEKPHLLRILSNNKMQFKRNYNHNTSLSPLIIGNLNKNRQAKSPIKTYNYINNNIIKTTPMKYQYKKLPFDKVRGFKIKLNNPIKNKNNNNNYLNNINNNNNNYNRKNIINNQQNYYPLICERNLSTIQSNMTKKSEKQNQNHTSSFSYLNLNFNNLNKRNIINNINTQTNENYTDNINDKNQNKNIFIFNDNKKPLYQQLMETKSSSIGSKLETREASRHFSHHKMKIDNNFHFHQFKNNNINNKLTVLSKKKIIKYLDKTIKQLNRIKTIILDEKDSEESKIKEDINQKFIKIIKKNNNKKDKDKNKDNDDLNNININFKGEGNKTEINQNNDKNSKNEIHIWKRLNRTITYDDLKCNVIEKQKLLNVTQKSFKDFKKNNKKKNELYKKYETLNTYNGDCYNNHKEGIIKNYKIKNYDTEIKIPTLNINDNLKLNKINEEDNNNMNNKANERYKIDKNGDNNSDIANFEFSD